MNRWARAVRRFAVVALACAGFVATSALRPSSAAAATCNEATAKATHVLCWLDLGGYVPVAGGSSAQSWTLPDGSTLTATVSLAAGNVVPALVALPTYTGSALGNTAYTGVTGTPAVYVTNGTAAITLSNITLTDRQNSRVTTARLAVADAETLDTGDNTNGKTGQLKWTTAGTAWSQLEIMPGVTSGTATPICTLSGLGTTTATCVPSAGGNNAAYVLTTDVTSTQSVTISATSGSKQGYAFAIELSTLRLAKTVANRLAFNDQFTVAIAQGGTTDASATTSGTGTTATTATVSTVPTDSTNPYALSDAASGSTVLSQYASTLACTNATSGSSTVLPSGNRTSGTLTPTYDDQITCTFTNTGLSLTDAAVKANNTVNAGTPQTDTFTLTNTSTIAGTFVVATPTITTSTGGTLTPTGYTFAGTTYATIAALNAAVAAAGPTATGSAISVGVDYTASTGTLTSDTVNFSATVTSGTGTSAAATASEVDSLALLANLAIAKTGTTTTSPGGLISYSILVTNNGPLAASGAAFSDPLPLGVVITGTPTCGAPTGGAVCGTVAVAPASGSSGQTVSSTVTTFPAGSSVTFAITASAAAAGTYTNTATIAPPITVAGSSQSSSLTTTVATANGLSKTVRNTTTNETATTADTGKPGDVLEYVLTFTNSTGATLKNFSVSDATPANTTFVLASCGALPTGVTACAVTSPAVGATGTVTYTYTGTLAAGASGSFVLRVAIK